MLMERKATAGAQRRQPEANATDQGRLFDGSASFVSDQLSWRGKRSNHRSSLVSDRSGHHRGFHLHRRIHPVTLRAQRRIQLRIRIGKLLVRSVQHIQLALQGRILFRQGLGHLQHFGQRGLTFGQSLTATDYGVAQSGDYGEGFFIGEGIHIGLIWIEGVG